MKSPLCVASRTLVSYFEACVFSITASPLSPEFPRGLCFPHHTIPPLPCCLQNSPEACVFSTTPSLLHCVVSRIPQRLVVRGQPALWSSTLSPLFSHIRVPPVLGKSMVQPHPISLRLPYLVPQVSSCSLSSLIPWLTPHCIPHVDLM